MSITWPDTARRRAARARRDADMSELHNSLARSRASTELTERAVLLAQRLQHHRAENNFAARLSALYQDTR